MDILNKPVEQLLMELSKLVTYPTIKEVLSEKAYDIIKLHKRDANIVRFIVPYSAIKQYLKVDTGYFNWKRLDRDHVDERGFFDDDTTKLGLPLTSGLELMTYIIFNKDSRQTRVGSTIREKWQNVIKTIYNNNFGTTQTIYYLERISLYAKKFGVAFDKNWKYFVDPTYWGHRYRDINWFETTKKEAIWDWFKEPSSIELSNYYDEFMIKFRLSVKSYFYKFSITKALDKVRTVEQFLYDPGSWATSGSTPGKNRPHDLYDFVPRKDLKNTKWILGLNDFSTLRDLIYDVRSERLNVNDKEEAGKVRIFVSAGTTSYLKQAYVGEVLFAGLFGNSEQTIFWSREQRFEKWLYILDNLEKGWNLPADLAKFDQKAVSRLMLICIFEEIKNLFTDKNFFEYYDMADRILRQYLNYPYTMENGERITMDKGMASGWYWTAFLDSIISWCFSQILITDYNFNMTQGDDILSQLVNKQQFTRFWWLVKRYNVEINPKKFYLDNSRAEYLRLSFESDGIFGYPSRAIGSLLWRKPWNEDIKSRREKLEASLSSWKRLLIRSGISVVVPWMSLDFRGLLKTDDLKIFNIARFDGGLGIGTQLDLNTMVLFETDYKYIKTRFLEYNFNLSCFKYAKDPFNYLEDKIVSKRVENETITYKMMSYVGLKSVRLDMIEGISLKFNEFESKTIFDSMLLFYEKQRDFESYVNYKFNSSTIIILKRLERLVSKKLYMDLILGRKLFSQNTNLENSDILMSQISSKCEDILINNILEGRIRTYNQLRVANVLLNRFSPMMQAQINTRNYRFCD